MKDITMFQLYDFEVEKLFNKYRLKVLDKMFYNIGLLKTIPNHQIKNRRNEFLREWFENLRSF